ncbi:DEAD/DEAH box helicase [Marinobacterium rhizophilum]|uniref:DEAD/DEAH box helicase n=1 Tax=Marinobacterium rhizophilum TaxID=420402 RepID=UPI000399D1F6|nr:DEAD/DEAH box helicase family protein [Marinobacterium rhizophilum]
MKLRQWQAECVDTAVKYYKTHSHFLCLATPGAGKSSMAAEVAARLLEKNLIDYVLCFSPSISVAEGLRLVFSTRLQRRLDGLIGAIGCSYTYQSMYHLPTDYWDILAHSRVLVIFDEIHHCAGTVSANANVWGEEILLNIQDKAAYTLSLTGTPWRSDRLPIAMARYTNSENKIICNYTYGLKEAVRDGVCRKPKIVLVDNEHVELIEDHNNVRRFNDLSELFRDTSIPYRTLISNEEAIKHILSQACYKLSEIRLDNPKAGGLVVAASVAHAKKIADILRYNMHKTVVVATYKTANAASTINDFRDNDVEWIVSVGMISEGTDIPRLQVCCHLSSVKTELYFRQVLGRILRINKYSNQAAWLYTFAEPSLTKYAERVDEELPDYDVVIHKTHSSRETNDQFYNDFTAKPFVELENNKFELHGNWELSISSRSLSTEGWSNGLDIQLLGSFRDRVISLFD